MAHVINFHDLNDTLHHASAKDTNQFVSILTHEAAMQAVFAQPAHWVDGSAVYLVEQNWHAAELVADEDLDATVVEGLSSLQEVLKDRTAEVLFVRQSSGISFSMLEYLLARAPFSKTVLWEATRQN